MIPKDLAAASTTPIVLSILAQGESYGYAIIQKVREISAGEMNWTDGMLYPVLHRLENQKLIKSRWRKSDAGRPRKYYRLTKKGKLERAKSRDQWMVAHSTLTRLWEEAPCSS